MKKAICYLVASILAAMVLAGRGAGRDSGDTDLQRLSQVAP